MKYVRNCVQTVKLWPHRESAWTLVIAHINLYLYNPHLASASYPFSSIDASVNADADADARCGQGIKQ